MFIQTAWENPLYYFSVILVVMISIILHELAHGVAAIVQGDDTPRLLGRMTLDPLVHMGPISLFFLVLVGIAFGSMPVDRTKLRGRFAETWVALAGPGMNFLLALLFALALNLAPLLVSDLDEPLRKNIEMFLRIGVFYNVILGVFNLLPIPPLDGYAAMAGASGGFRRLTSSPYFHQYGFLALFVAILGPLNRPFFDFVGTITLSLIRLFHFA